MKKIYTTIGVVLMASVALFAQKQVGESFNVDRPILDYSSANRAINDTVWPGDFGTGTPILMGSANGGFIAGNNGYGDLGKGQQYVISNTMTVEGALLFFGAKQDAAGSSLSVDLMDMTGTTGTTSGGTGDQVSPGAVLTSATVTMADVDTTGFTAVAFTPTSVSSDFYIGIEMSGLAAGDTVGLISSSDGDGAELTWEKWNDGDWYTMLAAWPLSLDFAIWALVDNPDAAGIEDLGFFNGIKAIVSPNPVVENANISIELENASDVTIDIVSTTGQFVYTSDRGHMAQGRHNLTVPTSDLAAGTYFYSIASNGKRLTQRMIIK
ncbi:MAG: hypothetical protein ACI9YU_001445 [Flavobacteriales bacterium]|jgi:hypothetical protein